MRVLTCALPNSFLDFESVVQTNGLHSLSVAVFSCSPEQSSDNMVHSYSPCLVKARFPMFTG